MAEARRWIGTPFHHGASLCGTGADCLGLIRGVWRGLYGSEAEAPPPYAPDWAEATGREAMLEAARRHLIACPLAQAGPGAVMLFRLRRDGPARHAGILAARPGMPGLTLIHARSGQAVAEEPFAARWARRAAAAFLFPAR